MTNAVYKAQAKRLAEHLARVHGVKLKQASMLEAIASLHGRADWNTLLACGPVECPLAVVATPPLADEIRSNARVTSTALNHFEGWLRKACESGASTLDIRPHQESYEVYMRVDGVRRRCHSGSLTEFDQVQAALYQVAGLPAKDEASALADELEATALEADAVGQSAGARLGFHELVANHSASGFRSDALALRQELQHQSKAFALGGAFADLTLHLSNIPIQDLSRSHLFVRLTSSNPKYKTLEDLRLASLPQWQHGLSKPSGVCLVAGTTGTGKTTTIVATARTLVREGRRVIVRSEEIDPRWVPGATFGDVRVSAGDVLVMGEIRTYDDARKAFNAAEAGALVITEIHAPSAQVALKRLHELEVSDNRMDVWLNVVVAQQLIRGTCQTCSTKPCSSCQGTGYAGRLLISEAFVSVPGRPITSPQRGKEWSAPTMFADAAQKYREYLTTSEELARVFGPDVLERLA